MNGHVEEVCQRWIRLVQKKERMKMEKPREERREVSAFVWVCIVLMVVVALYLRKWGVCWMKGVVLKGGGFVIRERERDLWWGGMVFAEMG